MHFFYLTIDKIIYGKVRNELVKLKSLTLEIDKLKNNLEETVFNSEGYFNRFQQVLQQNNLNQISDTDLDIKILGIIKRLKASEREAYLMELNNLESRVSKQIINEMMSAKSNFQTTLRYSTVESAANVARIEGLAMAQNTLMSTNLLIEKLKTEINWVCYFFT